MSGKLTFVTSNKGKLKEAKERFLSLGIEIVGELMNYPEVQADTLEEVARTSARWLKARVEAPFILDDSGLFIRALDGFPGVYSSYAYRTIGVRGILKLMEGRSVRGAVFRTMVAYTDERNVVKVFKGEVKGEIVEELKGSFGFGYDPIFRPEGHEKTFGEMETVEKNEVSHRAMAFDGLCDYLKESSSSG